MEKERKEERVEGSESLSGLYPCAKGRRREERVVVDVRTRTRERECVCVSVSVCEK